MCTDESFNAKTDLFRKQIEFKLPFKVIENVLDCENNHLTTVLLI